MFVHCCVFFSLRELTLAARERPAACHCTALLTHTAARRRLAPLSPLAPLASLAARARACTRAPLHAPLLAALGGERSAALELGVRDLVRLERRREVGRRDLGSGSG